MMQNHLLEIAKKDKEWLNAADNKIGKSVEITGGKYIGATGTITSTIVIGGSTRILDILYSVKLDEEFVPDGLSAMRVGLDENNIQIK